MPFIVIADLSMSIHANIVLLLCEGQNLEYYIQELRFLFIGLDGNPFNAHQVFRRFNELKVSHHLP